MARPWLTSVAPDRCLIDLWVVPGSSRTTIVGEYGERLKIRLTAPPEGGRANREMIDTLQTLLGAPVRLIAGGSGRAKRVEVALPAARVEEALR